MKGFLDYVHGDTILHKLNPLTKLMIAFGICVCAFITNQVFILLGLIALNLLLGKLGGIFDRAFSLLKGLCKVSLFLFILQLLFIREGNTVLPLPLLPITDKGLINAVFIVLRLIGATMPLALMLSLTQMSDLSNVFVTKLHIPYKYAFTFTTAVRFIPQFANEMQDIIEAQTARGAAFDTKNIFQKLKLILPLCVPLLITSVKKNESIAISAEIRGFYLRTQKSCHKAYPFRAMDYAAFAGAVLLVAGTITLCLNQPF